MTAAYWTVDTYLLTARGAARRAHTKRCSTRQKAAEAAEAAAAEHPRGTVTVTRRTPGGGKTLVQSKTGLHGEWKVLDDYEGATA
jgi:hypothetical protein